jgi:hypothetical protein
MRGSSSSGPCVTNMTGCTTACDRVRRIFERLLVLARVQTPRARELDWSLGIVGRQRHRGDGAARRPGAGVAGLRAGGHARRRALAFVLAHEMAHSILEHERQALTFARMLLPRDVPRSVADMYVEIDYNFALLKSLEPVIAARRARGRRARLPARQCRRFDPHAQLVFMEREAARDDGATSLLGTHPSPRVRLEQLRVRLPLAVRVHAAATAR